MLDEIQACSRTAGSLDNHPKAAFMVASLTRKIFLVVELKHCHKLISRKASATFEGQRNATTTNAAESLKAEGADGE